VFIKRPAALFVVVVFLTTVFWMLVFARQRHREHEVRHSQLKLTIPLLASNIDKQVATLERETLPESVAKLSDVSAYYFTGPKLNIISTDNYDLEDLNLIMSNRRFLKSFSELSKIDKAAAAQIIKTNLSSALTSYSRAYDLTMNKAAPFFRVTTNTSVEHFDGISFQIGVSPKDQGKETLLGLKLKVLTLVWISGMLNLTDNREQVERVVRTAIKQRMDLDNDPSLKLSFKLQMLEQASLYNRRILSVGLIGVTLKEKGLETKAMNAAGIQWQQHKLSKFDAAVTEYDRPVQSGIMAPDYSAGSVSVKFVSQLSETNFDILLKGIGFNQ
jgi:hypothetical protein